MSLNNMQENPFIKLLNLAHPWSRVRDYQLAENLILVFVCYEKTKKGEEAALENPCYTLFFRWSIETQNRKQNNLQNALSKSSPTHQQFSNCCDFFWGFQDFLIYVVKFFWSLLNFPNLIFQLLCQRYSL